MKTIERLAEFFYGYFIDLKHELFQIDNCHATCLLFLLIVSFLTVIIYYFVVDSNARNATPKNYLLSALMGYVILVAITFLGLATITSKDVFVTDIFIICGVNIIYFVLLFEIWSLIFKGMSKNSKNIDFISVIFNKNI